EPSKKLSVQFAPPAAKMDVAMPPKEKDIVIGAGNGDSTAMADTANDVSMPVAARPAAMDTSKKIIKEGDITFETKDVNVTRKALLRSLAKLGGYADEDNETLASDSDRKEYQIKARIPARNFDVFLDSLSSNAINIDSRHISISDVTTRYIDTKTRLSNQKALEATYLGLLKRASRMKDVLDIEDKVAETRTAIESEQGELNFLSRQIAYSTLDMTFYSSQFPRETRNNAGHRVVAAFSDGWHILQNMFFGLISVWPIAILALIATILFRKWRLNRKNSIAKPAS
ncbi:MAG: DUF4349 domain-containing protein, partial [Mucilaginibacter sp.]